MPRHASNPDRDFLAENGAEDIAKDLFGAPSLTIEQLANDPAVQRRIGELIVLAMNRAGMNRAGMSRADARKFRSGRFR